MSVSRDDVLHVARLARLRLTEEELTQFTGQLNSILLHVIELQELGEIDAEALASTAEWPAPLRDDQPGADPLKVAPAAFAPGWQDGFFTVPRLAAMEAATTHE